jgi:hypothetical protein
MGRVIEPEIPFLGALKPCLIDGQPIRLTKLVDQNVARAVSCSAFVVAVVELGQAIVGLHGGSRGAADLDA